MSLLPMWARKPKHKQTVVATSRGWMVLQTGEYLKIVKDLDVRLSELKQEIDYTLNVSNTEEEQVIASKTDEEEQETIIIEEEQVIASKTDEDDTVIIEDELEYEDEQETIIIDDTVINDDEVVQITEPIKKRRGRRPKVQK